VIALSTVSYALTFAQQVVPSDSADGKSVLDSMICMNCHGRDADSLLPGPKLGTTAARMYTPSRIGALAWNHVPLLATRPEAPGLGKRNLDSRNAAGLFAYFAAFRYFERPADGGQGKQLFGRRLCGNCHGLSSTDRGRGGPVTAWRFLGDPVATAQHLWNGSPQMRQACRQIHIVWSPVTSQELADLLLYLRNLRSLRPVSLGLHLGQVEAGQNVFRLKGCGTCHVGALSLERRSGWNLTDFAAAMWNHDHDNRALLNEEEMDALVGYLWSVGFFDERGSAKRGEREFRRKCASCHEGTSTGAPSLAELASRGDLQEPISATAAALNHGPAMLTVFQQKNLRWPRLRGSDLADFAAFLSRSGLTTSR
jgi:cytochrome c2